MSHWLESEKLQQTEFKLKSGYFTETARFDGIYKSKPRSFCLPRACAEENLWKEIRQVAIAYFDQYEIKWHDGQDHQPSNHLCDSQACCVNFLFPFADKPDALAALLKPIYPDLARMLPIENGQYVAHEWIGQQNYLKERISRSGKRTRGANFTSADAAVMFQRTDEKQQIVLIEWKYTESYGSTSLKFSARGTDRTKIYAHLLARSDCPIDRAILSTWDDLFYEPFYQFMRQQLLAHEMELTHELGADIVGVLHIAPAHNVDFKHVTSPQLRPLGDSAVDVWKKLVCVHDRFLSVSSEDLFGRFNPALFPDMQDWKQYVSTRYRWLNARTPIN